MILDVILLKTSLVKMVNQHLNNWLLVILPMVIFRYCFISQYINIPINQAWFNGMWTLQVYTESTLVEQSTPVALQFQDRDLGGSS